MSKNDFSQMVEDAIEKRGTTLRPRWHFLLKRSVFWFLAGASVLMGAASFSVADYVFVDNEGVGSATLLESPLEGIIQSLPILWVVLFALFAASTFLGFRNTRTGYQYRTIATVCGVIVLTICLGLVLNIFDFGQVVHYYLLHNTNFYDALIFSSDDLK